MKLFLFFLSVALVLFYGTLSATKGHWNYFYFTVLWVVYVAFVEIKEEIRRTDKLNGYGRA